MRSRAIAANSKKTGWKGPIDRDGRPTTAFRPGQSGNPSGRPKKSPITDAYRAALTSDECKALARELINRAKKGSIRHLVELTDRVEGRSIQRHELNGYIAHELSENERNSAIASLKKIAAFNSESEMPLIADRVCERNSGV